MNTKKIEFDDYLEFCARPAIFLLMALLLGISGWPATASSLSAFAGTGGNTEWWIASRTDGRAGTGTINDPINVSSEAKFDGFFAAHNRETYVTVHIGPGVFITRGGTQGDFGWQILGSGMDKTIIRLDAHAAPTGNKTQVLGFRNYGDQVVRDMTLDGNIENQSQMWSGGGSGAGKLTPAAANICILAVRAGGLISHVKAINCGSPKTKTLMECFWIDNQWTMPTAHIYNQITENCIVIAPDFPSYDSFIVSAGYVVAPPIADRQAGQSRNSIIRNNYIVCRTDTEIHGNTAGFVVGFCDSGIVENNYSDGISQGFYTDTGSCRSLVIRSNTFKRCQYGCYFNLGYGTYHAERVTIEDNEFDLVPDYSSPGASDGVRIFKSQIGSLNFNRNRIHLTEYSKSAGANNGGFLMAGTEAGGVRKNSQSSWNGTIQDNCIDLPNVANRIWTGGGTSIGSGNCLATSGITYENNYDSLGDYVIGQNYARISFVAPQAKSWYRLFARYGSGVGQFRLTTNFLQGAGTSTLVAAMPNATRAVADPFYASGSVFINRAHAGSGVPGGLYETNNIKGIGFTVSSTSPTDDSTFSWYAVRPASRSSGLIFFGQGRLSCGALTEIGASSSTEAQCATQVRTYPANNGWVADALVAIPCKIRVDCWPGPEMGDDLILSKTGTIAGPTSGTVTALTLGNANGVAINTTGSIQAAGSILQAGSTLASVAMVESTVTDAILAQTQTVHGLSGWSGSTLLKGATCVQGPGADFVTLRTNADANALAAATPFACLNRGAGGGASLSWSGPFKIYTTFFTNSDFANSPLLLDVGQSAPSLTPTTNCVGWKYSNGFWTSYMDASGTLVTGKPVPFVMDTSGTTLYTAILTNTPATGLQLSLRAGGMTTVIGTTRPTSAQPNTSTGYHICLVNNGTAEDDRININEVKVINTAGF
jgi:hypothetical protein